MKITSLEQGFTLFVLPGFTVISNILVFSRKNDVCKHFVKILTRGLTTLLFRCAKNNELKFSYFASRAIYQIDFYQVRKILKSRKNYHVVKYRNDGKSPAEAPGLSQGLIFRILTYAFRQINTAFFHPDFQNLYPFAQKYLNLIQRVNF